MTEDEFRKGPTTPFAQRVEAAVATVQAQAVRPAPEVGRAPPARFDPQGLDAALAARAALLDRAIACLQALRDRHLQARDVAMLTGLLQDVGVSDVACFAEQGRPE